MIRKRYIHGETREGFAGRILAEMVEARRQGEPGPYLVESPNGNLRDVTDLVKRAQPVLGVPH